jgi:predicted Zn-dependent protease
MRKPSTRAWILLIGLLTALAVMGGAYAFRKHQSTKWYLAQREQGIAAAKASDHVTAVDRLSTYLSKYPDDVEALAVFVASRPKVPGPKNSQLSETIYALRHLVKLQPNRIEERRTLAQLYAQTNYWTEAKDAAEAVLAKRDSDVEMAEVKTTALLRLNKPGDALAAAVTWQALAPNDIDAQMTLLFLAHQVKTLDPPVAAKVEKLQKAEGIADSAQAEIVRGYALLLNDERTGAKEAFQRAADAKPTDRKLVLTLVRQCDIVGSYELSERLLKALAESSPSEPLWPDLARRMWEQAEYADAAELLKRADPADPKSDSELLALRAMIATQLGDAATSEQLLSVLKQRADDVRAVAWSKIIGGATTHGDDEVQKLITACEAALKSYPGDAYLRYFAAEGYAHMGRVGLAEKVWREVAEQRPAWPAPVVRLATTSLAAAQYQRAYGYAEEGMRRAGRSVNGQFKLKSLPPAICYYKVALACLEVGTYTKGDVLLQQVQELQKEIRKVAPPDQELLAIEVDLLGRFGRPQEAKKLIDELLTDTRRKPAQSIVLKLIGASQRWKIGAEDQLLAAQQPEAGTNGASEMTPQLATYAALRRVPASQPTAAVKEFDGLRAKASNPQGIEWQIQRAWLQEHVGDKQALAAWATLADGASGDLRVQRLALESGLCRADAELSARLLSRVKDLAGEDDLGYRLANARILAAANTDAQTKEAITLLTDITHKAPDLAEARVLLASCYQRLIRMDEAVDQWTIASRLIPNSPAIWVALARALYEKGDFDKSREILDRASASSSLADAQRREMAVLWTQLGEDERAKALAEKAVGDRRWQDLLMFHVYARAGQMDQAETVLRRLLQDAPTDDRVIRTGADFLAARGKSAEAAELLARLDQTAASAYDKKMARAEFAGRYETLDKATTLYREATALNAKEAAPWLGLIRCYVAANKPAEVLATIAESIKSNPEDKLLQAVRDQGEVIAIMTKDAALRSMANEFLGNPMRQDAVDCLTCIKQNLPPDRTLTQLTELAARYPNFVPLQLYLARRYRMLARNDDAITCARRALKAAPSSAEAFLELAMNLTNAEQWAPLRDAAQEAHAKLPDPALADLWLAQALLGLKQPKDAVKTLEPYLRDADKDSALYKLVFPTYVKAKQAMNEAVGALMDPLLAEGAKGRAAYVTYAYENLEPVEAAAWLERVAPLIPQDAQDEKANLSQVWGLLAKRDNDNPNYEQSARDIIFPLADKPDATIGVLTSAGIRSELDGKLDAAEKYYRGALKLNPNAAVVQNNLAMVLGRAKIKLPEAEALANAAIAANPGIPSLYDTLAFVQSKAGKTPDAVRNMQIAVRLRPSSVEYRLHLAQIYFEGGQKNKAADTLKEMDSLRATLRPEERQLPKDVTEQIEELRTRLGGEKTAASDARGTAGRNP